MLGRTPTSLGDGDTGEQLIHLLVVPDSQLKGISYMPRRPSTVIAVSVFKSLTYK